MADRGGIELMTPAVVFLPTNATPSPVLMPCTVFTLVTTQQTHASRGYHTACSLLHKSDFQHNLGFPRMLAAAVQTPNKENRARAHNASN